MIIMWTGVK